MADAVPSLHVTRASTTPSKTSASLEKAKTAVKYMLDPNTGPQPTHLRTRAFLRSLRYLAIFIFWRVVRYAKYAAVGAAIAAVSGTAIGSVMSGAAFVIAPTGIVGGAGIGLLWAFAKFGWRRAKARVVKREEGEHGDPRRDEMEDAEGRERVEVRVPGPEPW